MLDSMAVAWSRIIVETEVASQEVESSKSEQELMTPYRMDLSIMSPFRGSYRNTRRRKLAFHG